MQTQQNTVLGSVGAVPELTTLSDAVKAHRDGTLKYKPTDLLRRWLGMLQTQIERNKASILSHMQPAFKTHIIEANYVHEAVYDAIAHLLTAEKHQA